MATTNLNAEWHKAMKEAQSELLPPPEWDAAVTGTEIGDSLGTPYGGMLYRRLQALVKDGTIRAKRCRDRNGDGRLAMRFCGEDVVRAVREELLV